MKNKQKKRFCPILFYKVAMICFLWTGFSVAQAATQQNPGITVTGTVTDAMNDPLIGAAVKIKGTSSGTITDINGQYSLTNVPVGAILEFSYVGMDNIEVPVDGRSTVDAVLHDSALLLDQVVVIGYGSVKKSDLTGSVASVKPETISDIPANSVEGLLQGRAAGVQVINNSQDPGAGSTVRIRGNSSLRGSNSPLIVVDGFPLGDAGDLKQINTDDIISMEVLKDASASAIYGSRGANGVIMVTTRRAKEGTTTISVKQQLTFSEFSSELDLWRDPVLMAMLSNEGRVNGGLQPLYIGANNSAGVYFPSIEELQTTWSTNTRWDDLVFRDAPVSNNTTISISSANEKTSFNLSANYFTDQGMYIKDDYSKGGYNLNVSHKVYDNFTIRASNILYVGNRDNNGGLAYWRNPIYPVYNEDGTYYQTTAEDYEHPIALREHRMNKTKMLDIISSGAFEWQVLPQLRLTNQLNYKFGKSTNDQYLPQKYTQVGTENRGRGIIGNTESQSFVSETFANYSQIFNDMHEVGAMVGHSYEWYEYRDSYLTAQGFVNESLGNENLGAGEPASNLISNGYSKSKLISGMARLNYTYNNKYLATVTFRADGSSKFGKNNKWGYFPSGAISWKAQEEEFIKNLNVFDELKFRLSYGISGNQGISPYQTLSRYGTTKYYNEGQWLTAIGPGYVSGNTGQDGIYMVWSGIPNPDLKWETTAQWDFGIDMAFFNRRLRLTLDVYNKETSDLLRERNLALSSGYDRMWVNDGKIRNRGFEATIDGVLVDQKDWSLNSTFIFSMNRNKVLDLGSSIESGLLKDARTGMEYEVIGNLSEQYRAYTSILAIGQPINVFYGYKTDGIIQTLQDGLDAGLTGEDALPGEYKYVNIYDGDGTTGVINENDKCIIGDPNPDFTASLNLALRWKNFDASIFLNGVFGNDVLNTKAFGDPHNAAFRWTPDNQTNKYPSLRDGRQTRFSDYWIEDGSFVRIQNLSLGYTFDMPKRNLLASKIRLYVNASNLYTFTKFDGYDPEVGQNGIYSGGYPRLRKWTVGLDITFLIKSTIMKTKINFLILISCVLGFAGCSLDEEPYGFYSEDNFYKTEGDAKAAIHYAYATLTYIEYSRALYFIGDMPTEILTTKGDASVDNRALNTWRIDNFDTNGTLVNFFKYSYIAINRANAVIKKMPDTDIDQKLKDQYLGEAYFLRAYNYFCLSRNFGLVPMHSSVVETISQTGAPLAQNMDEIYDLMIEDCQKAEELLPVYTSPTMGRIDRVGVQALLAKIYLYAASAKANNVPLYRDMTKDVNTMYENAATYAGRVLGMDAQYPQSTYGFENDLLSIYDVENFAGRENIFLMAMDRTGESEGQYSKISKMFLPYVEGATIWIKQGDRDEYIKSHDGWGEYRTERAFYDEFDDNDLRKKHLIVDKVYDENGNVKAEWKPDGSGDFEYPFSRKYIDPQFDGDKTSTRPFLIRYTDIAMVYAEAAGPTSKAYEVMNFIRNRAGLGQMPPGLGLDDFRNRVYEERRFEMAYEGDRMYDIRRWGRIGEIQEVKDAGLSENQYSFYPLPQAEISLNPSLRE